MVTKPRSSIFNPYSDLDRFRREVLRRVPGVVNRSEHMLRTGGRKDYYFDFDPIINDPIECRAVVSWYVDTIRAIRAERRIHVLGFLEKDRDSGGTTGAIRLAGAVSIETGIPNLAIRLGKEVPAERIKLRTDTPVPIRDSLRGLVFVVLTDHSTTGSEGLRAIEAVEFRGGTVSDFIVYSIIDDEFREDLFKDRKVKTHAFLHAPDDIIAAGIEVKHK